MKTELPLIIVNPVSGKGTSEKKWASMVSVIHTNLGPFDHQFTRGPGDATRIAEEAAISGRRLLISVGGDGTVSEVANGILRSKTNAELGMLPGGTGSDYRNILKLSTNLADAAREIKQGVTKLVDVGLLRYIDHAGTQAERFFVNTASFGMSGKVASRANQSSKILGGTLTYIAGTLRTLLTYDHPEIQVEWDGNPPRRLKILTGCVSIGPTIGGGMKIAPDALTDDGLFDVTLIGDLKLSEVLINSHKLYNGAILSVKKVGSIRAPVVKISPVSSKDPVLLEVDGESPGMLPATMEIVPKALRVRVGKEIS